MHPSELYAHFEAIWQMHSNYITRRTKLEDKIIETAKTKPHLLGGVITYIDIATKMGAIKYEADARRIRTIILEVLQDYEVEANDSNEIL